VVHGVHFVEMQDSEHRNNDCLLFLSTFNLSLKNLVPECPYSYASIWAAHYQARSVLDPAKGTGVEAARLYGMRASSLPPPGCQLRDILQEGGQLSQNCELALKDSEVKKALTETVWVPTMGANSEQTWVQLGAQALARLGAQRGCTNLRTSGSAQEQSRGKLAHQGFA
jgi:hypothetical protein